jgi:hypothetical protein
MNDNDIERIRVEMIGSYPGCNVNVAKDKREIVAEVSEGFAVAVIERSLPQPRLWPSSGFIRPTAIGVKPRCASPNGV